MSDRSNAPEMPTPLTPEEIRAYLDYQTERLRDRRDEIVRALEAMAKAHPRIEDDEVLGDVAENYRMGAALKKTTETHRVREKSPFLEGGRVVDKWFESFIAPMNTAMDRVQGIMDDFGRRKLAAERAEAERRRAIAQAEADRAAAEAAAAFKARQLTDEAIDRASEAAREAERAEAQAQARPAELTRTRGTFGAVASARETWSWEVENFDLIPRDMLMVNNDKVKAMGRARDASGKPTAVIPGIRWVSSIKMGVR
jgi:hypothetical protein